MSLSSDYAPSACRPEIYPYGQLFGRSDVNLAASTSVIEGLPDEQRTSPVRRTYLLLMLFDLLFCFILWVVYVQALATLRFVVTEVVYGAFVSRTPWFSAAVTGITCCMFVAKCFVFDFHQHDSTSSGLIYVLITAALILTWIETSFLIYRVIPQEKAASQVATCFTVDEMTETRSLLGSLRGSRRVLSTYTASRRGYYTPLGSLFAADVGRRISKAPESREAAIDIAAMLSRANQLHSEVWYLYRLEAWGSDPVDPEANSVRSANLPGYDPKVFRLETLLDAPAHIVYDDFVYNVRDTASWNPMVASVECLQSLPSENIDIVHNIVHDLMNGAISKRDFVLLRHWREHDGCYSVGLTSVEHPKCPPMKYCVRAHQPINAVILEPVAQQPNRCKVVWLMCFDLKLCLPQRLVHRFMHSGLFDLLEALQKRAKSLCPLTPPENPDQLFSFPSVL
ncbi:unnamed protein product [Dicrocoelium dendriticum]|nr:unnamed protein product [Dicrocoelium dendriticum]